MNGVAQVRNGSLTIAVASILVSAGLPALAHHSFAAEFDASKHGRQVARPLTDCPSP